MCMPLELSSKVIDRRLTSAWTARYAAVVYDCSSLCSRMLLWLLNAPRYRYVDHFKLVVFFMTLLTVCVTLCMY
jgi:hypothetical protein